MALAFCIEVLGEATVLLLLSLVAGVAGMEEDFDRDMVCVCMCVFRGREGWFFWNRKRERDFGNIGESEEKEKEEITTQAASFIFDHGMP